MCISYWLHYHHVEPCTRDVELSHHTSFCESSTLELSPVSNSGAGGLATSTTDGDQNRELVQVPCAEVTVMDLDFANLCATGGCLLSQHCASGGCRLEELGGRWSCCRCDHGGNTFRWCVHPLKKVPDALCYHVVCRSCRMDG